MTQGQLTGPTHPSPDHKSRSSRPTGYKVLRFSNTDVRENVEGVVTTIRLTVETARQCFG
ncbi:MAG: DUF559 domain-containing protein [Novosphingobium sp.]|uniref:DUF559 domain-containing protein n=1 Tax=Novosphingobium sp. TaxID=1874826 RepID=UPI00273334BA|nr:DUF559 domain-containing protein [Novosphingobium sp.]MDP3551020.1 DUF559 domain-containing protein [Novosphingobium sp.]